MTTTCPHCSAPLALNGAACAECGRPADAEGPELNPTRAEIHPPRSTLTLPPVPEPAWPSLPEKIGRFEVRRFLGEGTFGRVYAGYDPILDRAVALKVAKPDVLTSPDAAERFLREARAAANLRHPYIIPVYDSGRDAEQLYIASALIVGETLQRRIKASRPDARASAGIVRRLAEALGYAHKQGVVHRDVKPANVMLDESGSPLLMDFGLAIRGSAEDRRTRDGVVMGTAAYMAPEQAAGRVSVIDGRADQYSLGCILYELLTGRTPFSGPDLLLVSLHQFETPPPPREIDPTVPVDLEAICLRCLEREPDNRYPTCRDLADDLRQWENGDWVSTRPPGLAERAGRWARRNPVLTTTVVLALFGLGVTVGVVAAWIDQQRGMVESLTRQVGELEVANAGLRDDLLRKGQTPPVVVDDSRLKEVQAEAAELARAKAELGRTNTRLAAELAEAKKQAAELAQAKKQAAAAIEESRAARAASDQVRKDAAARERKVADIAAVHEAQRYLRGGDLKAARAKLKECSEHGWEWWMLARQAFGSASAASREPLVMSIRANAYALAFSPDGSLIAVAGGVDHTGGVDYTIQIWQVADGKLAAALKGHTAAVRGLAFDPESGLLASCSADHTVRLWDVKAEKLVQRLNVEGAELSTVVFAKGTDGSRLYAAGGELVVKKPPRWHGRLVAWDGPKFTLLFSRDDAEDLIRVIRPSPDGKMLLTAGYDRKLILRDPGTGEVLRELGPVHQRVIGAVFNRSGERLFCVGGDWDENNVSVPGRLTIWDLSTGKLLRERIAHDGIGYAITLGGAGDRIATAGSDGMVHVFDQSTGDEWLTLPGHTREVRCVAFSPDGTMLASGGLDGTVRLWNGRPLPAEAWGLDDANDSPGGGSLPRSTAKPPALRD